MNRSNKPPLLFQRTLGQNLLRVFVVFVLVAVLLPVYTYTREYARTQEVQAATGINRQINFQGKLVNPDGTNVTDGSYNIKFSIYTVSSGGASLWTETQSVSVSKGIFQVNLGSVTPLPGSVDFNTDNIYLGITVQGDAEMTPRIQFTSVPQAFNAEKLGGLDKSGFIQNSTSLQSASNFYIQSNNASNVTAKFRAVSSQTADVIQVRDSGDTTTVFAVTPTGTITAGTWNGTALTDAYVSDTLTSSIFIGSGSTTNAIDLGSAEVAGTLAVANGGTGLVSYTVGDLLFASGTTTLGKLAAVASGSCLTSQGVGAAPAWGSCTTGAITSLTLAGTSGSNQTISSGDTITIAAGNNITTTGGATDTVTVATVNNPNFTTSVTTPTLTSSGALGIQSGANGDITINANGTGTLQVSDASTFASSLSVTGALTANGNFTANDNVTFNLSGTENANINSDLDGSVNVLHVAATPSATAGTTRGLFIQQVNSANTNGLDQGITINNADTDLPITTGIQFINNGGGGYTNYISAPSFVVDGTGTITSGTWNGTALTDAFVSNTLTASILIGSGSTTNAVDLSTAEVAGTLGVGNGGTGLSSYAIGDLLYASGTSTLSKLAAVASGSCLISQGVGTAPTWGSCGLAAEADTLATVTARGATTSTNTTFNGTLTANSSVNFSFTGTQKLAVTSDLNGTSNPIDLRVTPSNTAGTNRGLFIQQNDGGSATNGLNAGVYINNAETDLAIGNAIQIVNSGGGGYTNLISAPSFVVNGSGTITSGTWNGTALTDAFVSDTLTASILLGSGSTTNAVDLATAEVAGTLAASNGGTGIASYTVGDLLYASGTSTLSKLAAVASGSCLISQGTGTAPVWGSCATGGGITGSGTNGQVTYFSGAGSVTSSANLLFNGTTLTANALTVSNAATFNGLLAANNDVDLTFNGTQNLSITSDLVGTSNPIDLRVTPSTTAGTNRGLFIQQNDGGTNTNGLNASIYLNNAETDLAITNAIQIANTGGGGYTNLINSPTFTVSGAGAITGATGLTSSGTIRLSALTTNGFLKTTSGNGTLGVSSSVALGSSDVSGTLAVANGGTGATTLNDLITLGSHTTGNYVASNTAGVGIAVTGVAGEGWSPSISLDYAATLAGNPTLAANQSSFASTGLIFEGSSADTNELLLTVSNPGSDVTLTLPSVTGTIISTGNITDITGLTDSQISDTLTASNVVGSGSTSNAVDLGTTEVSGALSAGNGGTGLTSYTAGDLLYASGASTLGKLAAVASGSCLISQGTGTAPAWGSCGLASEADTLATVTARGATTSTNVTFNGTLGVTSDTTFTFSGTENLVVNSDLAGSVNMAQLTATPSSTAGTTRGFFIQQANSANTNGLDTAMYVNNADTDLAIGTAFQIANSGGGGYTNYISAPSFVLDGTGTITTGTWNGTALTDAYVSDTLTASNFVGTGSTTNNIDLGTGEVAGTLAVGNGGTGATSLNDLITLGTHTTGNYVANINASTGIAVTGSAGEGWSPTIALDYAATLAGDPTLAANQSSFASTGLIFEGSTANTIETLLTAADPSGSDVTLTLPNVTGTLIGTGNISAITGLVDSQISDTLTVDWTGLQNYPSACSAGQAITALADSPTCTSFLTSFTEADTLATVTARGATTSSNLTFNGTLDVTKDTTYTFAGNDNLTINSDLNAAVNLIQVVGTPSATAGTTRGLFIQQADSANTNGLDIGMRIDNADTDMAINTAIQIANSGGGGYTSVLSAPSFNLDGTGTITAGTWNGTALTDAFVSNTLTASILIGSGSTSNAVDLGTAEVAGTLGVANGGTGLASYTVGDLLYASGTTTIGKLAAVASGSCLTSQGVGAAPAWGSCGLAAEADTLATVTGRGATTSTNTTFNGTLAVNNSVNFSFTGTQKLSVTSDLNGSSNPIDLRVTPSNTAGTNRGLFIQQNDDLAAGGTNGLNAGLYINNAEADLVVTNAIQIASSGAAGYTNLINTPSFRVNGSGAISGATGISSSGTISLGGTAASSLTTTTGALTLTGAAASTWSTSAGTLTLQAATTLNLGTATTTGVSISRTGVATTINGSLTVTQAATMSSTLTVTGAATFNGGINVANNANVVTLRSTTDIDLGTSVTTNNVTVAAGSFFKIVDGDTTAKTIRGFTGGTDGRTITFINSTGSALTLATGHTSATAGNRIYPGTGGSDISIRASGTFQLIYDTSADSGSGGWRTVGDGADTSCSNCVTRSLDNLTVTSINQDLLSSAPGTKDIGSSTNRWNWIYGDRLDIRDNASANPIATFTNTNTWTGSPSGNPDILWLDFSGLNCNDSTSPYLSNLNDFVALHESGGSYLGGITAVQSSQNCGAVGSTHVAYKTNGADYAEYFLTDPSNKPAAYELVSFKSGSQDKVTERATNPNLPIIGAVSTTAGFVGNGPVCVKGTENGSCIGNYEDDNSLVSLVGQVKVKVNHSNGAIAVGDPIGLSTTPGVGSKLLGSGYIVGYAMESLDSSAGEIQVLIRPSYFTAPMSDVLQGSNLSVSGDATINGSLSVGDDLNVSGATTLTTLTVTGSATIQGNLTVVGSIEAKNIKVNGHIITAGGIPTVTVGNGAGVASGTINAPLVEVIGNDTSGTITITAGANGLADVLANIDFNQDFGGKPHVMLTAANRDATKLGIYYDDAMTTNSNVKLMTDTAPEAGKKYIFSYFIVE